MDVEVDAMIEGSLVAEISLCVLDTLELLVQTLSMVESLQSMRGRVLEVGHTSCTSSHHCLSVTFTIDGTSHYTTTLLTSVALTITYVTRTLTSLHLLLYTHPYPHIITPSLHQ